MKTRVISGVCYAVLFVAVLFFMDTPVLPVFVALVSAVAVYELTKVAKISLPVSLMPIAVGAFIPFDVKYGLLRMINIEPLTALIFYTLFMLILMIALHSKVKFEQIAVAVFSSLAVPSALSCWIRLWELPNTFDGRYTQRHALFLILFAVFSSWLTDIFAYFTGVLFGKHKMTPVISPKKTWEGAAGGVLITAAANVGLFLIFQNKFFDAPFPALAWYAVIPLSMAFSVLSMLGDLSASVIKRNFGVKDYGWIIPGHGGVMDRFDSIIFVFPAVYAAVSVINAF